MFALLLIFSFFGFQMTALQATEDRLIESERYAERPGDGGPAERIGDGGTSAAEVDCDC